MWSAWRPAHSGREVTSVVVRQNGAHREVLSRTSWWSSCGAINSAALLLRSANDKHPRGLANGSDVVGRHYMGHMNSVLMAVAKCPNPVIFQKTLSVNDFYHGCRRLEVSHGPHLLRRKAGWSHSQRGRTRHRTGLHVGSDGKPFARFLADVRGSAGSGQPRHARPRRQHRPELPAEQRRGPHAG